MRQKKPLESTVEKYMKFLLELKYDHFSGRSMSYTIHSFKINKSIVKALVKLNLISYENDSNWQYINEDCPNKNTTLEVLNYLLELNKKQVFVAIPEFDDIKVYIKEIRDHMASTATQNNNSLHGLKSPLLSRALQQSEMNNNHLFSQVESKEAKLFELIKSISSAVYVNYSMNGIDISYTNDYIIQAAKDLLSKL